MERRISCPMCQTYFRKQDRVVVDIVNTIIHRGCIAETYQYPIKESGTYDKILQTYPK